MVVAAETDATAPPPQCELVVDPDAPKGAIARLSGAWRLQSGLPVATEVFESLRTGMAPARLAFDTAAVDVWDTGLVAFVARLRALAIDAGIEVDPTGLPDGVVRLLRLALAVPESSGAREPKPPAPFLQRVGEETRALITSCGEVIGFLGEVAIAFGRLVRGRARFRGSDFWLTVQEVGAQALPIVSLISFLVGVILAFLGAIQLVQFGAQIFVATLVGIGMARDMGPMMVGVILAGRTGAAFAAQLGTMQVNEEIDALKTFGFPPMEFLVLPRMLALMLMTPLLCLYAVVLGILGGALMSVTVLDLNPITYYQQTADSVGLIDLAGGLVKGTVYGAVIAVCGCLRGIECGRSSAAVGAATTSAVVTSLVFMVLAMAVLTVIYNALGI